MTQSGRNLAEAQRDVALARSQMRETIQQLRARVAPRQLICGALDHGRQLGEHSAAKVKRHPVAIAGLGGLFLAVVWYVRRRKRAMRATGSSHESFSEARTRPRRTRRP